MRRFRTPIIVLGSLVLVFGVLYPAFGYFYIAVNTKDVRYDTAVLAAKVVYEFVNTQTPPRWPLSWDELSTVSYKSDSYYWPEDRLFVERFVAIDFSVSYEDITESGWPAKPPIAPIGWSRDGWEEAVWDVINRNETSE